MLEHDIDLWKKLTEDETRQQNWTVKEGRNKPVTCKKWSLLDN